MPSATDAPARRAAGRVPRPILTWALASAALALVLRLALGPQGFALYGVALVVLAALAPLGRMALRPARRRWPVWLLIGLTALLALGQIGFWLYFFHGGGGGLFLGIGRSMTLPYLDGVWRILTGALILVWIVCLLRAALRPDFTKAP
jgi:hypothetical protein